MDPSTALTLAFAAFLVASLAAKFWLSSRQVRHVARHRAAVPPPFAGTVSLAAHQKAADYTVAKSRVGLVETAFGGVVLLGWTLLGGLDALNRVLVEALGTGMWQQLALLACFAAIACALRADSTSMVEESIRSAPFAAFGAMSS